MLTPCRLFSSRKKVVSDSFLNYTEGSPESAEDSHRVLAFLDKFLISLFHPYFVTKILISEKVPKIDDSN